MSQRVLVPPLGDVKPSGLICLKSKIEGHPGGSAGKRSALDPGSGHDLKVL